MKKLIFILLILFPVIGFGQGKTIAFQKNMKIFNGQESSYFLDTTSTAQAKSGQISLNGLTIFGDKINADYSEAAAAANETRYYDFLIDGTVDPAANAEITSGYFRYNKTAGSNGVYIINGIEGVAGSSYADEAGTFRGVYGRTYTSAGATATMRTAIGGEFSARAGYSGGTDCVAESGTAFAGARIWMAPYFSSGTLSNINNFHGLWLYNEHTSNTVTNAIYVDDAGGTGGWTNGINFSGAIIGTAEFVGQNSATIDNVDTDTLTLAETVVQIDGILNIIDLKTSTTTVLTPTSAGNVDTLETVDISDITIDTINVDFINVTNDIDVGDTIEFDNGAKIYNTHVDTLFLTETYVKITGDLRGYQSDGVTPLYYHEHNIPAFSAAPGAAGATLTVPTANTLGGYQFDANTEQLYFSVHIENDWDGATDITIEVHWEVNEAAAADGTVDLQLISYYKGDHESANKTQTEEVAHTITGNKAQFTQHKTTFTINWDEAGNVVQVEDIIGFILNLETDTSECDDIIINHMISKYRTTQPALETN